MSVRDRVAAVLIAAAVPAAFAGAWLQLGLGVALLVVAALAIAIAVALTAGAVDEIPAAPADVDERVPMTATPPHTQSVQVKNPFLAPERKRRGA